MNEGLMKMLNEYGISTEQELNSEYQEAVSQVNIGIMASTIEKETEKTA